jgi:hypothetical protein
MGISYEEFQARLAVETGEVEGAEEREGFRCETPEQANWALEGLAALSVEDKSDEAVAAEMMTRAATWLRERRRRREGRQSWFASCIEFFARTQHAATAGKEKSWSLPNGRFALRKPAWAWVPFALAEVEDRVTDWLGKNRPEFVRVKAEPNFAALRKAVAPPAMGEEAKPAILADTGEVIPDLFVQVAAEPKFTWAVGEPMPAALEPPQEGKS